jgi:hypothetical protein
MSTTPVRGHSSRPNTATRIPTTFIRSATATRRVDSSRSTPTSSSTSRSTSRSTPIHSTSSSTPTPTDIARIVVASFSSSPAPTAAPTSITAGLDSTCFQDSDCAQGSVCSSGTCSSGTQSDLFESVDSGATSHLNNGSAIGIVAGVLGLALVVLGIGFWCMIDRKRKTMASTRAPPSDVERQASPRTNQTVGRSASAATKWTMDNDQKTLVASLPNSPQYAGFSSSPGPPAEFYMPTGKLDEIVEKSEPALSTRAVSRNPTSATRASSVNKALPTPPAGEMTYALNVSINKSMIFEDSLFSASTPQTPRSRGPRYRFEEVLPPAPGSNPRISVTKPKSAPQTSRAAEYEMDHYPYSKHSSVFSDVDTRSRGSTQYGQAEVRDLRGHALKRLEGDLPLLPSQAYRPTQAFDTVPPSPSFSFRSYDWYQDILDPQAPPIHTPDLSSNANAFGANPLLSHPFAPGSIQKPSPLTLAPHSQFINHLHPSSALSLDSPTSPGFRLSPTVYQMPSRTPQIVPSPPGTRPSSSSTMASSRSVHPRFTSWQPNDDNMIPEDDLPLPRYPRKKSMAASLVMAGETPTQTPTQTRRGSRATIKARMSWLPKVGLPGAGDDSFAVFKRDYLSKRDSYAPLA